jgi:RHS repeat-associated protein
VAARGDPESSPTYEPDEPPEPMPLRTVWYTYWEQGQVANITIRDDSAPDERHDLAFYYNGSGTLWMAVWSNWEVDEDGVVESSHTFTAAREFRFDSPRERYMVRDIDPATLTTTLDPLTTQSWTEYDGVTPYLDFTVTTSTGATTDTLLYASGLGLHGQETVSTSDVEHFHGDLIGSTVLTTNSGGTAESLFCYTAFGEPVGDGPTGATRYGYAGSYGYEDGLLVHQGPDTSLAPVTLHHVGARWYEAAIGRFVQRDPIGIVGGLNVYNYVEADPVARIDANGKRPITQGELEFWARFIAEKFVLLIRTRSVTKMQSPSPPVSVAVCLPIANGLDVAARGLGPTLRYRRAVEDVLRANPAAGGGHERHWDDYERHVKEVHRKYAY